MLCDHHLCHSNCCYPVVRLLLPATTLEQRNNEYQNKTLAGNQHRSYCQHGPYCHYCFWLHTFISRVVGPQISTPHHDSTNQGFNSIISKNKHFLPIARTLVFSNGDAILNIRIKYFLMHAGLQYTECTLTLVMHLINRPTSEIIRDSSRGFSGFQKPVKFTELAYYTSML